MSDTSPQPLEPDDPDDTTEWPDPAPDPDVQPTHDPVGDGGPDPDLD